MDGCLGCECLEVYWQREGEIMCVYTWDREWECVSKWVSACVCVRERVRELQPQTTKKLWVWERVPFAEPHKIIFSYGNDFFYIFKTPSQKTSVFCVYLLLLLCGSWSLTHLSNLMLPKGLTILYFIPKPKPTWATITLANYFRCMWISLLYRKPPSTVITALWDAKI